MKVELLIHGVLSNGQTYWKQMDKNYQGLFYKKSDTDVMLRAEIRKGDLGLASYYTYLRYDNIVARSGRTGSYFGMTVCMEGHICNDIPTMYDILDKLFRNKIVGTILQRTKNGYNYLWDDFQSRDKELKAIEESFGQMFMANINFEEDLVQIKSFTDSNSVFKANPIDISPKQAEELLTKGTALVVSREYPFRGVVAAEENALKESKRQEQSFQMKLDQMRREKDSTIAQKETRISDLSKQKSDLEKKFSQQVSENQALMDEIDRLKAENESLGAKKEILETLEEINEPLQELARRLARGFPEGGETDDKTGRHRRSKIGLSPKATETVEKVIIAVVFVLALSGIGVFYFDMRKNMSAMAEEITLIKEQTTPAPVILSEEVVQEAEVSKQNNE